MKTLTQLDKKAVKIAIKKGEGLKSICTQYDCKEKEAEGKIKGLFDYNSGEILANLKKNDRKGAFKKAQAKKNVLGDPIVAELDKILKSLDEESGQVQAQGQTQAQAQTKAQAEIAALSNAADESELSVLKRQEQETEQALTKAKSDIEYIEEDYKNSLNTMKTVQNKLKKLEKEVKTLIGKYEGQLTITENLANELQSKQDEVKQCEESLIGIKDQIKELEKIVLCVFANGEISPYNEAVNLVLDDSGFEEIKVKIFTEMEIDQCLRLADVKTLARLIQILNNLDDSVSYELLFDNEEIEKAFHAIKDNLIRNR